MGIAGALRLPHIWMALVSMTGNTVPALQPKEEVLDLTDESGVQRCGLLTSLLCGPCSVFRFL